MVVSTGAFKDVVNGREKRTDGILLHVGPVEIRGGPLVLPNGSITSAAIADGAIGTADLAVGASQALIGQYVAAPTFSSTTTLAWLATPISAAAACSGAPVRIDVCANLSHSALGGLVYFGLLVDGVLNISQGAFTAPGAGYVVPIAFTYYYTPSVATHTFALGVYNNTAGTLALFGLVSTLFLTEQRR